MNKREREKNGVNGKKTETQKSYLPKSFKEQCFGLWISDSIVIVSTNKL